MKEQANRPEILLNCRLPFIRCGSGPRFCISSRLTAEANAAVLQTPLGVMKL